MIKCGYPLPNIRTLQKRTEHLKFEPGMPWDNVDVVQEDVTEVNNKLNRKS